MTIVIVTSGAPMHVSLRPSLNQKGSADAIENIIDVRFEYGDKTDVDYGVWSSSCQWIRN
jgi:hypothetical protein